MMIGNMWVHVMTFVSSSDPTNESGHSYVCDTLLSTPHTINNLLYVNLISTQKYEKNMNNLTFPAPNKMLIFSLKLKYTEILLIWFLFFSTVQNILNSYFLDIKKVWELRQTNIEIKFLTLHLQYLYPGPRPRTINIYQGRGRLWYSVLSMFFYPDLLNNK